MVRLRILLVLVAVGAFVACDDGPNVDAVSQRLLDRYEIEPTGPTTTQRLEVGEFAEDGLPWNVYLEASQAIELDFTEHFGEPAEIRTTPVEVAEPDMRLHVLVLDGSAIGAWLGSEDEATGGGEISSLS